MQTRIQPFLTAERTNAGENVRQGTLTRSRALLCVTIIYGAVSPGQALGSAQWYKDN